MDVTNLDFGAFVSPGRSSHEDPTLTIDRHDQLLEVEAELWARERRSEVLPSGLTGRERARLQYDIGRGDPIG